MSRVTKNFMPCVLERLELISRAKEGRIDVIISTLVGEEGVDIPEAGLLVMSDVPRSPLRFYQRLGRLIRLVSPKKIKYLVVSLTPKTREYWDLEEALWNLYGEGVDVSYIIVNVDAKGPENRILDILDKFSTIYNETAIPYTLITQGRELSNPLDYLLNIVKNDKGFLKVLKSWGINVESEEKLGEFLFAVLTFHFLRWDNNIRKALKRIDDIMNKSSFSRVLDKAIEKKQVFYIYDVDKLSELVARELIRLYKKCLADGRTYIENNVFRLDKKSVLRLYTKLFPFKHIEHVKRPSPCIRESI